MVYLRARQHAIEGTSEEVGVQTLTGIRVQTRRRPQTVKDAEVQHQRLVPEQQDV